MKDGGRRKEEEEEEEEEEEGVIKEQKRGWDENVSISCFPTAPVN